MRPSVPYKNLLIKDLQDPKRSEEYLNSMLEECKNCDEKEAHKILVIALRDVVEAQGGIAQLSQRVGYDCEILFKELFDDRNCGVGVFIKMVHAMGFDLRFSLSSKR